MVLLAGAVALGCQKKEALSLPIEDDTPLSFMSVGSVGSTKGATPTTDESLRTSHFGIFAYWVDDDQSFSGVADAYPYLKNRELVYSHTEETTDFWVCNPAAYWPIGGSMTFFGYAPFMDCSGPVLTLPSSDTQSMPRGHFAQKSAVSELVDFCLAAPAYDRKKNSGEVPLVFTHALSKVLFYFNLKGERDPLEERRFMVKRMTLSDVVGENSFTYGGLTGYRWDELPREDVSSRTADYELSLEDGTLSYIPLPYESERTAQEGLERYECVNGAQAGLLYLLPQPMTGVSSVTIVLSAYHWDSVLEEWIEYDDAEMDPVTISLPEYTVWDKGQTVAYSATLEGLIPIAFNVELLDWDYTIISNVGFNH